MKVIPSKWIDDESNSQLIMALEYAAFLSQLMTYLAPFTRRISQM
jgi:hypothetical protein